MRVFHVISGIENGGVEVLLCRLIAAVKQPIEFHIVAHDVTAPSCKEKLEALGATLHFVPCRKHYFAHKRALRRLFLQYAPDAVHVHTTEWGAIALAEAKRAGVPLRIQHSHAARRFQNPVQRLFHRLLFAKAARCATKYVACGGTAAALSFPKRIAKKGPVHILPNGIDTSAFAFDEAVRQCTREALGLVSDTVAVGMVARFSRQKNHRAALRIFAAFYKICPNSVLLLVGDGPLREATARLARKLLPEGAVHFLGVREDIAALYAAMDRFILPSRFEGLPITLLEAQAAGLAPVAADTVAREVNYSGNVTFLSPKQIKKWVEALENAAPPVREGMAQLAADSGYTLAAATAVLTELYGLSTD